MRITPVPFLTTLALGLVCTHAFASTTDTIGANDSENGDGDMLKVTRIDVTAGAVITTLKFGFDNQHGSDVTPVLVLYKLDGSTYNLVGHEDATGLPHDGAGWGSASPDWVLDAGATYAIGAWVPDHWYYWYADHSANPWFGAAKGSYRYSSSSVPASFHADQTAYYYYMQIVSEATDADGDGHTATTWGGDDCNDSDPTVYPGAPETCGDGIDQDCNGADTACTGDTGISDSATSDSGPIGDTAMTADSAAGDTANNGDTAASDTGPTGGKGPDVIDISPGGCGCATAPEGASFVAFGLAGLALSRRRSKR